MSNFDALVAKLREIFQIDRPDLDFGVYRILNARAGEIEDYLSSRIKARVAEALATGAAVCWARRRRLGARSVASMLREVSIATTMSSPRERASSQLNPTWGRARARRSSAKLSSFVTLKSEFKFHL